MPTIDVDGATLAYMEAGTGEPVLALHCTGSSGTQWSALREHLEARFRLIAPDLYGYGGTDPWPGGGPITLADEAALVTALTAGCTEPVHLVGHSFGGAVALRMVLERPTSVRSLTLIEPVAFHLLRNGDPSDEALFGEIRAVADEVWQAMVSGAYWRGLERFVDYWSGPDTWARTKPEKRRALCGCIGKIALDFRSTTAEPTPLAAHRRIHAPTLILRGERSPPTVRRITELLAATLPAARLQTVAGAGHMLPLTHSEVVNAAIAEHLACAPGARDEAA